VRRPPPELTVLPLDGERIAVHLGRRVGTDRGANRTNVQL